MSGNFCIDADGGGVGWGHQIGTGQGTLGRGARYLAGLMRDGCWVVDKPPIGSLFALHVLLLPCDHRPLGCSQEYCNMRNLFPGACRGGREVAGPAHHKQCCPSTSYTFRAAGGDAFSLILTIIPPYLETHPEKPPCRRCCGYASRAVGT